MEKVMVSSLTYSIGFVFKYMLTTIAFADTDSLAHLNDDENVDETGGVYGDSDEESDGGVGLGD
jgi:hypothetical protein